MNIIISNTAGIPIYEQIESQIKESILSGELKEGDALPSLRQLAKDLKISVITTMRAYNELEAAGFVVNVQGKGCFVLPKNLELLREQKLKEVESHMTAAIEAARLAKMPAHEIREIFSLLMKEYGL